jgi:hypothetical protein
MTSLAPILTKLFPILHFLVTTFVAIYLVLVKGDQDRQLEEFKRRVNAPNLQIGGFPDKEIFVGTAEASQIKLIINPEIEREINKPIVSVSNVAGGQARSVAMDVQAQRPIESINARFPHQQAQATFSSDRLQARLGVEKLDVDEALIADITFAVLAKQELDAMVDLWPDAIGNSSLQRIVFKPRVGLQRLAWDLR